MSIIPIFVEKSKSTIQHKLNIAMRELNCCFSTKFLAISTLVLLFGFSPGTYSKDIVINVLTYNIRLATPDDAPNTWNARKQKVFSIIRESKADVFGLQEALHEQVVDIKNAFPDFTRVGVGRDDGKEAGEYSPLFFNAHKYKMLSSGTFWLSQTPSVAGSRGWDAACNRVVSWVQLKEYKTGKVFFVFCTHFDHMGELARRNSAKLLIHSVDSLSGNNPAIVLGDFNSKPGSEPYQIITDNSNPIHLLDAKELCKKPVGPKYTFTGFKVGGQPGDRIDYIFLKDKIKVLAFKVDNANNGDYYPSDHLPVYATLEFD